MNKSIFARLGISAFVFLAAGAWAVDPGRVVLFYASRLPHVENLVSSFQNAVLDRGAGVKMEKVFLPDNAVEVRALMERARTLSPTSIFMVGGTVAQKADEWFRGTPMAYTFVLENEAAGLSGVPVPWMVPADDQVRYLAKNFPGLARVGVVYSPGKCAGDVEALRGMASRGEARIVLEEIPGPQEMEKALDRLHGKIDCLMVLPDPTLYTAQHFPQIILKTLQMGVPVVGFSPAQVRAGAFLSFSRDFSEVGRLGAAVVLGLSSGRKPEELRLKPSEIKTVLNLVVAKRLSVSVDSIQVARAEEVVR